MANEKKPRRRKKLRQEWNPHWSLKLLYMIFSVAGSVLKIAVGAAATVLLIVLICGTVFVGTLGDYLQEDILTEAADWSLDDYDLEQTSFIYYVDNHGDIQLLQQLLYRLGAHTGIKFILIGFPVLVILPLTQQGVLLQLGVAGIDDNIGCEIQHLFQHTGAQVQQ